jgi:two-component system NtrC family sensor kinase
MLFVGLAFTTPREFPTPVNTLRSKQRVMSFQSLKIEKMGSIMIIAKKPTNEVARQERLESYQVLDSATDKLFDDIAKLASHICGTSVSLITLLDNDRQWMKAKIGTDISETPRDVSFCSHAILEYKTMVVPNALKDKRFKDNPLVSGAANVRFYAGAPLTTSDGLNLGTLCVLDSKPKKLTPDQISALESLARQVMSQLELRLFNLKTLKGKETAELLVIEQKEKLALAAKLSSLGELSGAIAHEIRNPLSLISNYGAILHAMAESNTLSNKEVMTTAERIEKTVFKINRIIKNLRIFIRDGSADPLEATPVKNILADVLELYKGKILKQDIRLLEQEQFKDVSIDCRPSQIYQVIINLLNNSCDALEGKEDKWVKLDVTESGNDVVITVKDSGHGIPKEVAAKLFKSYYTTKAAGKGTGMGLNISKKIAEEHGGSLTIDHNCPNTCFVVRLPKSKEHLIEQLDSK